MTVPERLWKLFRGLDRAYGTYTITGKNKNKVEGTAKTIRDAATEKNWKEHIDGSVGLGIVPITGKNECHFAAIDVDIYEGLDLTGLLDMIKKLKLPLVPCMTKSGGVHLYMFCKEPISAKVICKKMTEFSLALGFSGVEIFPKQTSLASEDDVGNWINMPYFGGDLSDRYAMDMKGNKLTVEQFINVATGMQVSKKDLLGLALSEDPRLKGAPPCLKVLGTRGFPEGSRNQGLFCIGVYLKCRYDDAYEDKIDEYNRTYMKPPLSSKEVQTLIRSLKKKEYFYKCSDTPLVDVCNKRECVSCRYGISFFDNQTNVAMENLCKVDVEPPIWFYSVNGARLKFPTTADLMSQAAFRNQCVEKLHVIPRPFTPVQWSRALERLLSSVTVIPAPYDADECGQVMHLLTEFIEERGRGTKKADLNRGKPWINETRIYFRSTDFLQYLRKHGAAISPKKLYMLLRDEEVDDHRFNINGKGIRCWSLPKPSIQTDSYAIPEDNHDSF